MMDIVDEFDKNTKSKVVNGRHIIECKKGLWSVDCPTRERALLEAFHYFKQYHSDGEYYD